MVTNNIEMAVSVLSPLSQYLTHLSVRDCIRIGKYSADRSDALLVKMIRSREVSCILSNRGSLPHQIKSQSNLTCPLLKGWSPFSFESGGHLYNLKQIKGTLSCGIVDYLLERFRVRYLRLYSQTMLI